MNWIDIGLYLSYALTVIAIVAAIVLPLVKSLDDPKSLVKTLISFGVLLVIFLVCYALSGNEVTKLYEKFGVGETGSKIIGGSLIMTYLMFIVTVVGVAVSEVSKLFK